MKPRPRTKPQKNRHAGRTVPKQLIDVLVKHVPGFCDEKKAFEIAWMLWCSLDPSRAHRQYPGAIWMHTDDIRRLFGEVKHFQNTNRGRYFRVERHLNGTESPKDSYTNGYTPMPWMQKAVDWVIQSGRPLDFVDSRGASRGTPTRAISSTDTHGHVVRRWKDINVPPLIPVNIENLQELLHKWDYILNLKKYPKVFERTLERYSLKDTGLDRVRQQIQALIAEAQGGKHPGMLPIRYVLHQSGRLYAEQLNLQSCKREIRQAALAGCWDVDINTCHFAIMAQMAKLFGVSCPVIEDYVARKRDYREQIARDIGVSLRDSKKVINAVGYGAPLSTSNYTEIPQQIGREKAAVLFIHPLYVGIKEDVDAATEVILQRHPTKNNKLINLANRAIATPAQDGGKIKKGTLMAHLLQGVEAAALEAAVRACDGKVLVLQHDGFTASEAVDPDLLTAVVLDATGYKLTFDVEKIQMPFGDLKESDLSFNKKFNDPKKSNSDKELQQFWPCYSGTVALYADGVPPVFPLPLAAPAF